LEDIFFNEYLITPKTVSLATLVCLSCSKTKPTIKDDFRKNGSKFNENSLNFQRSDSGDCQTITRIL